MYNTPLRSPETWEKYQNRGKSETCVLCEKKTIRDWNTYWATVGNAFPYDVVAEDHHMLIPKRHIGSVDDLTKEEIFALREVKNILAAEGHYNCFMENFPVAQTQPSHYHMHLLKWKKVI